MPASHYIVIAAALRDGIDPRALPRYAQHLHALFPGVDHFVSVTGNAAGVAAVGRIIGPDRRVAFVALSASASGARASVPLSAPQYWQPASFAG